MVLESNVKESNQSKKVVDVDETLLSQAEKRVFKECLKNHGHNFEQMTDQMVGHSAEELR